MLTGERAVPPSSSVTVARRFSATRSQVVAVIGFFSNYHMRKGDHMTVDVRAIRAAIVQTTIGGNNIIRTPPGTEDEAERVALEFSKSKKIPIIVSVIKGGIEFTRVAGIEKPSVYPEIDALLVGQYHVFPFPPSMHGRVRAAASARNKTGSVRYACSRDGDQIRVTRLPLTPEENALCGKIPEVERLNRWARLSELATKPLVIFEVEPKDHQRLRVAASQKAKTMGWMIRCRLQDNGTMAVYRTDPGANVITYADGTSAAITQA